MSPVRGLMSIPPKSIPKDNDILRSSYYIYIYIHLYSESKRHITVLCHMKILPPNYVSTPLTLSNCKKECAKHIPFSLFLNGQFFRILFCYFFCKFFRSFIHCSLFYYTFCQLFKIFQCNLIIHLEFCI